jgi:hypothetical protein
MDHPDQSIAQQVMEFLSLQTGINATRISLHSRIESDLGTTGDDADELMEAFFNRFGVDRQGFRFDRHFNEEGFMGCLLFWRPRPPKKIDLTVGDLVKSADEQRWSPTDATQARLRQ